MSEGGREAVQLHRNELNNINYAGHGHQLSIQDEAHHTRWHNPQRESYLQKPPAYAVPDTKGASNSQGVVLMTRLAGVHPSQLMVCCPVVWSSRMGQLLGIKVTTSVGAVYAPSTCTPTGMCKSCT